MIDYSEELEKLESELTRIEKEIKLSMDADVIFHSWEPMKKKRLRRIYIIEHTIKHELLFI